MTNYLSFLVKEARRLEWTTGLESRSTKSAAKIKLVRYCLIYLAHEAHQYVNDYDEGTLSRDTQDVFLAVSKILDRHLPTGSEGLQERLGILAKSFDQLEPTVDFSKYIDALNATTQLKLEFSRQDAQALMEKVCDLCRHIKGRIFDTFPILASVRLDDEPAPPASQQPRLSVLAS